MKTEIRITAMTLGASLALGGFAADLLAQPALDQLLNQTGATKAPITAQVQAVPVGAGYATPSHSYGSVKLDKAEYTVPGMPSATTGDVVVHLRVNDPDFSPQGSIATGNIGPVFIKINHNGQERLIYTAGGEAPDGIELGPMQEIAPGAGIFQADLILRGGTGIVAGDILEAEFTQADLPGADGKLPYISKDQSDFAMFSALLQTDQNVYSRGGQMILTLVDPNLNRDSNTAEKVDLHTVHFVTDGIDTTLDNIAFDALPGFLTETGRDTGIFQVVLTVPGEVNGTWIAPGAPIRFVFDNVSPQGAKLPGELSQTVQTQVSMQAGQSNDGFDIVAFDTQAYQTSDIVTITLQAPDLAGSQTIGGAGRGNVTIAAGGETLSSYALTETGPNTGIFTGKVQLSPILATGGSGPNSGVLRVVSGENLKVTLDLGPYMTKVADNATIK